MQSIQKTYLTCVSDKKITSITSSIFHAQQYLEETTTGTGPKQLEYFWQDMVVHGTGGSPAPERGEYTKKLAFFWYCAVKYGRVEVMLWAHQSGYSSVWVEEVKLTRYGPNYSIGESIYLKAAKYGQLGALQWLTEHGCRGRGYLSGALSGAVIATGGGHLSVVQWLRESRDVHWTEGSVPLQLYAGTSPPSNG